MSSEPTHTEIIEELESRGFNTDWAERIDPSVVELSGYDSRSAFIDMQEVEGQVTDGLFEDPYNGPEYDFTLLLTDLPDLVGRLMYYGMLYDGLQFSYEDLVDDIEELSNTAYYDAPFNREEALSEY